MPDDRPAAANAPAAEANAPAAPNGARRRLFAILGGVILSVAVVAGLYWLLLGQWRVSTDDAYVDADTALITPQVSANVVDVPVGETQLVHQGDVLVRLDDSDAKVALASAEASLAQAERRVRGYYANAEALGGQIQSREADIARADAQIAAAASDLDRARTELDRRQKLAASGAVSGDELTQAENAFANAKAALDQARAGRSQALANRVNALGARDVNAALISGVSEDRNPEVAAAQAKVDQARLDLDRTVIRSPIDGVIAQKTVSVGQRVAVGANLMSVVPIQTAHVNANFKEVQLEKVRVGQPVTLVSDYWGAGVKFHGHVTGIAGGTGAAFALIPAQNATGNWIKVVQRLPVRIALDPAELHDHPLRVGLSMRAEIDVSQH